MPKSSHIPEDFWELPRTVAEARASSSKYYFTGKPCGPKGHVAPRATGNQTCQACTNELSQRKYAERRERERPAREAEKAAREALRNDPEYQAAKKRQSASATRRRRIREETTEGYFESEAEVARERYQRNREQQLARAADRRSRGLVGSRMYRLRTPPWLTDDERAEMKAFDANRPADHEVDHIAPIDANPFISGLHVPWNLQYLKRRANKRKDKGVSFTRVEAEEFVERGMAVRKSDVSETGEIDWSKYPRPARLKT